MFDYLKNTTATLLYRNSIAMMLNTAFFGLLFWIAAARDMLATGLEIAVR